MTKDEVLLALRYHGPTTAKALGSHPQTLKRLVVEELVRIVTQKPTGGKSASVYALTRRGAARARKLAK